MASTNYQVTIGMDDATVTALAASGFSLLAFSAVACSDQSGAPLVWARTQEYSETTVLRWTAKYQAYTAFPGGSGPVVPGFSAPVSLGQTLTVQQSSGIGTVTRGGTAGAVTLVNATSDSFQCGISQAGPGGFAPVCVLPLHGEFGQIVAPLPSILLLFSTAAAPAGTAPSTATGPGVLVDMSGASERLVGFDINRGWSWGDATWGTAVPFGKPLAPLLVQPSAALAARALLLASRQAAGSLRADFTQTRARAPRPGPCGPPQNRRHVK